MKLKYRTTNPKYLIYLSFINLFCICILCFLAYIDNVNMINNGYISNQSISFTLKDPRTSVLVDKDKYILFQFSSSSPYIKHVLISGDVQLPPIKYIKKVNLYSPNANIAIIGKQIKKDELPSGVDVIGYFETPNSYKLNSEVWLLSKNPKIDIRNGTSFIFTTPKQNERFVLKNIINKDSINIINRDNYGTYSFKSNKTIIIGLKIALFFLMVIFFFVGSNWLMKNKYMIRILYLSGIPIHSIYVIILKWFIFPYCFFAFLLIFIAIAYQNFISSLWSGTWVVYAIYFNALFILFLCLWSLFLVTYYTVGKGGKKY